MSTTIKFVQVKKYALGKHKVVYNNYKKVSNGSAKCEKHRLENKNVFRLKEYYTVGCDGVQRTRSYMITHEMGYG